MAKVFYEKAVSPITITQGHHNQVRVSPPRSRKAAMGTVTPQK